MTESGIEPVTSSTVVDLLCFLFFYFRLFGYFDGGLHSDKVINMTDQKVFRKIIIYNLLH